MCCRTRPQVSGAESRENMLASQSHATDGVIAAWVIESGVPAASEICIIAGGETAGTAGVLRSAAAMWGREALAWMRLSGCARRHLNVGRSDIDQESRWSSSGNHDLSKSKCRRKSSCAPSSLDEEYSPDARCPIRGGTRTLNCHDPSGVAQSHLIACQTNHSGFVSSTC
jgi:hypothetical protein